MAFVSLHRVHYIRAACLVETPAGGRFAAAIERAQDAAAAAAATRVNLSFLTALSGISAGDPSTHTHRVSRALY